MGATQSYQLDTSYSGATFFNGWDFFTGSDPTDGFVNYLSGPQAAAAGLVSQGTGIPAYMGVDSITSLSTSAVGRPSVRITSQKSWTHGLFIADIAHMPDSTCGAWPAFWMFGPNWPDSGEIDIIEGVSRNTNNLMSLHTGPNCVMTAGADSGTVQNLQCDSTLDNGAGCGIQSNDPVSYGTGFNSIGGGVYATEWTSDFIQTFFFPRNSIPSDIASGTPNPGTWGVPQSLFQGGSTCDIDAEFANQNLVFDTTFCGNWAGNVWTSDPVCSALAPTCIDYVAGNPGAYSNAYWQVNNVQVYTLGYPPSTTSTSTSTTSSTKTSTSSTSTTTTTTTTSSSSSTKTSTSTTSTSTSTSTSKSTSTTSTTSTSTSTLKTLTLSSSTSSTKTTTSTSTTTSSSSSKPASTSTSTTSSKTSTSTSTSSSVTTVPTSSSIKTSTKASSTTSPTSTAATPSWTPLGCYSDNVNGAGRALPKGETVPGGSAAMTVELCQTACKGAGYAIAGLEYSQECWCGNAFVNGGAYVGPDGTNGCTDKCKGNSTEWCGGSLRLSAYKWTGSLS